MMKLTVFELKKLRADRLLTVAAAIAVCIVAVFAFFSAKPPSHDREATERILASFEASPEQTYLVWEEKQQAYRDYLNDETADGLPTFLSDYDDYRRAWELFSRQTRYHDRLERVLRQTQGADPVSAYISSLYKRNQSLRLSYADMEGLPALLDVLAIASSLVMLLSVLLGITLAYADRSRGTEQLLFASANGRTRVRVSKLFAACICTACFCAVLFAAAILPFSLQNGFASWGAYLQNHESFFVCPYPFAVWQAVLLLYLLTVIGALALGVLSCLIGKHVRRQAVALLLAALPVVMLGSLSLYDFPDGRSLHSLFSPFSFCNGNTAFGHLYGTQIGAFAVGGLPLVACAWALLCVLLCAVYALHHVRAASSLRIRKRSFSLPSVRVPRFVRSVGMFEGAKQFLCNKPIILLLPLLVPFAFLISSEIAPDQSYKEQAYRAYMLELQGAYTDEKQQKINGALAEVQQTLAQKEETDALFASGALSRSEMSDFLRRYGKAQAEEQALTRVSEQLDYVRAARDAGQSAEIVYDSGWNILFSFRIRALPVLLICAVCCGLFAEEYKNGMHRLFPRCMRRRIAWSKFAFALCFAPFAALCFEAVQIGLTAHRVLLAMPLAPASSVSAAAPFGAIPLFLSACLSVLCRVGGYMLVALISTLCSRLLRQKHAAFVCGVLSALPWLVC